jgi:putative ABC transport system substrate-binding protein
VATPLVGEAQPAGRVVRIGLLDYATSDLASATRWKAFRDRLGTLGHVEGQSVVFEARWGDGHVGPLPGLATELIDAKVDILVTSGSSATAAAKQATTSIPIVMATGGDPVALGLVTALARPGGNVTGVISLIGELTSKRLEILKQLLPRAARVALVRDPDNRSSSLSLRDAQRAAKSLGVVVHEVRVGGPGDLEAAFLAMKRARTDAVIFGENTRFIAHRRRIADLAITHRLPMVVAAKEYAEAGVLISYGTDYRDLFSRAATYVDRIIRGAKPADLPIEQPTTFELVINVRTARTLGLTISSSLLARANELIE